MILASGYYGFGNLGDEAILAALCRDLESLGIHRQEIVVPSGDPERTAREHGVRTLARYDLKAIWKALGSARLLVSGGGSLLQDVTSKRSIPYYLTLVELALLRRVPVVMYAQGLGPIRSSLYCSWTARAYKRATACSVRDEASLGFLRSLGVPDEKVVLAADPVFGWGLSAADGSRTGRLVLNLRPYHSWTNQQDFWVDQISRWQRAGWAVEFLPLGPGDRDLGEFLRKRCPRLIVAPQADLAGVNGVFKGAELCISMRLHGIIFSVLNDCQPVGINYDPKVEAICTQLRVPHLDVSSLGRMPELVEQVLADGEQRRKSYRRALAGLQRRAENNRRVLAQVLR